jgi:hypothetical protein
MMKVMISISAVFFAATIGQAAVDLEWRTENQNADPGETVRIGLYAVADNDGTDEPFSALEAVVEWDPTYLSLAGVDDNGPYSWLYSGFCDDSGLDGLNDTFEDGDAYYQAWGNFSEYPVATPEGLLVTTFEFEALSCADETDVALLPERGLYSVTAVYDEVVPGLNIVDDLDVATVQTCGCLGDLDGDGYTNLCDLATLLGAFGSCVGDPRYNSAADLADSGCIDLDDLEVLLRDYGCGY